MPDAGEHHAQCPVIVASAGADQPAPVEAMARGPVVAGVDEASAAGAVVAFALAEAAARGHELVLVHADDEPGTAAQGEGCQRG